MKEIKNFITIFTIVLIGLLFLFYFKIKHQMTFINLDELLWMYRSRFFIDRIFSAEFSNLIQSSQPGIMAMWLIGPFMKIVNYDFASISNFISHLNNSGIPYNIINGNDQQIYSDYKELSFLLNIPILSVIFLFIFSLYYLLKRLCFNKWAIIFSLLLLVTTPYHIYFTTPTDKLVGIFSSLSILSLLVYADNKGGRKFLFASAVLCSWAVLTKISALFLVPFSFLVLAFYKNKTFLLPVISTGASEVRTSGMEKSVNARYLFLIRMLRNAHFICLQILQFRFLSLKLQSSARDDKREEVLKINFYNNIRNTAKNYFFWLITFSITSVIFLPTIITNPRSILNFFTKESSERAIAASPAGYDIFLNFKIIATYLSDPFLLSFNLFIMAIFIAFICLIIQRIKNNRIFLLSPRCSLSVEDCSGSRVCSSQSSVERLRRGDKTEIDRRVVILIIYCLSFFAFVTLFSKTYSFRYLVPSLIVFQIIAGIGIYEFSSILAEKNKTINKNITYLFAAVFILLSQVLLIYYSAVEKIEELPYFG